MVTQGQYVERPTLIPVERGLVLEGVAHRGDRAPGLLILPPPPIEGGGMDHVAAAEIAFATSRAGHPTLRFNYRGVGASQGQRTREVEAWLEDAAAALALAIDNAGGTGAVVASIGASDAVALELAARRSVAGLILVSPSVVRPGDLVRAHVPSRPLAVVLAELELSEAELDDWRTTLERLGAELTVVSGATSAFLRNLPMVGKAVAALVGMVGRTMGG